MAKIQDLSILERPREKAQKFGIEQLSNAELIAILISGGCQNESALDIAHKLISDNCGLSNISKMNYIQFQKYKGIGLSRSLILASAFQLVERLKEERQYSNKEPINTLTLANTFKEYYKSENKEKLVLVFIKNGIFYSQKVISIGNEHTLTTSKSQIIQEVLNSGCKSYYMIHNHPSGNSSPSNEDIKLTMDVMFSSKDFKLRLIDHLIITVDSYYSFTSNSKITY